MAKKWTKEKIKNLLLKEYKKKNITLSSKEIINNKYLPNPDIINKYFGKNLIDVWKEIEKQEGIVLNYRKNKEIKTKISKEKIIVRAKELSEKLGRIPTFREYKKEYGFNQISNKFEKGYLEVLYKADLIPKWKLGMSKEEMIDYLQEKIDSGELKSFKELMFNREFPTLKIIYKSLGCKSLKEIEEIIDRVFVMAKREKRGYKSIKGKSTGDLMNEYNSLCKKLGKIASGREISENLGYSSNSFVARFGSIKVLRKMLGYENPWEHFKWTKEEIKLKLLEEYKKNNNRKLKIREIQINDNLPSVVTIKSYFRTKKISEVWEEIL